VPALVVVPSALQASRAARRLCDAGGGLLFGSTVTTLETLTTRLLASAGDRRAVLTPLAERLLAVEAGDRAGGPLAGLQPGSGLAGALAATLAELRRGEVPAGAARVAAGSLGGAAGERLAALARALEAFEDRLDRLDLLDGPGAARAAAEAVQRGVPIDESGALELLLLDGFTALSPGEWALVEALAARARRTRFQLPVFADAPALSGAAEPLLRRVEALHDLSGRRDLEVSLSRVDDPARAARPAALLAALSGGTAGGADFEGELLALAGAGEDGEAALAARTAAGFIAGGIPPPEIVVFAPSPRRSAPLLAAAFAAEGVPFASGRDAALSSSPPVGVVLAALGVAAGARDRQTLERLAGSTYLVTSGLGPGLGRCLDAAGALDGRADPEASLRGRAAALEGPWATREREALERAADGLASLVARLRPLSGDATASAHAARLTAFLDGSGLRRQAGHQAGGRRARPGRPGGARGDGGSAGASPHHAGAGRRAAGRRSLAAAAGAGDRSGLAPDRTGAVRRRGRAGGALGGPWPIGAGGHHDRLRGRRGAGPDQGRAVAPGAGAPGLERAAAPRGAGDHRIPPRRGAPPGRLRRGRRAGAGGGILARPGPLRWR
jgi:hypothetical protein